MSDPWHRFYTDELGRRRVERADGRTVCDFCLSPDPRWEYPAGPMELVGHVAAQESIDEFLACETCRRLIDDVRIGALVEHCIAAENLYEPAGQVRDGVELYYPPLALRRRAKRENILRFMEVRTGPARPWSNP